jgi:hypothetical protein
MTDRNSPPDIYDLYRKRTRDQLHDGPMYHLRFDGRKLGLIENGTEIANWSGVSGKEDSQGQQHQIWEDHGPVPSGRYKINVDQIQELSARNRALGAAYAGEWPGSWWSWGNYRAWLTPAVDTAAHGRSNMAIHGGAVPGSKGCIDLTDEMEEFVPVMRALGQKRVDVIVDYGPDGAPNHRLPWRNRR